MWTCEEYREKGWAGLKWLRITSTAGGACERGVEPSGSLKARDFLTGSIAVTFSTKNLHNEASCIF
jgi:hypothetical protein